MKPMKIFNKVVREAPSKNTNTSVSTSSTDETCENITEQALLNAQKKVKQLEDVLGLKCSPHSILIFPTAHSRIRTYQTGSVRRELSQSESYRNLIGAQLASSVEEVRLLRLKVFDLDERLYATSREVLSLREELDIAETKLKRAEKLNNHNGWGNFFTIGANHRDQPTTRQDSRIESIEGVVDVSEHIIVNSIGSSGSSLN